MIDDRIIYLYHNTESTIYEPNGLHPLYDAEQRFAEDVVRNHGVEFCPNLLFIDDITTESGMVNIDVSDRIGAKRIIQTRSDRYNWRHSELFRVAADMTTGQADFGGKVIAANYGDKAYLRVGRAVTRTEKRGLFHRKYITHDIESIYYKMRTEDFLYAFRPVGNDFPLAFAPYQRPTALLNEVRTNTDPEQQYRLLTQFDNLAEKNPALATQAHADALLAIAVGTMESSVAHKAFTSRTKLHDLNTALILTDPQKLLEPYATPAPRQRRSRTAATQRKTATTTNIPA